VITIVLASDLGYVLPLFMLTLAGTRCLQLIVGSAFSFLKLRFGGPAFFSLDHGDGGDVFYPSSTATVVLLASPSFLTSMLNVIPLIVRNLYSLML
jgi:hypothetical protein